MTSPVNSYGTSCTESQVEKDAPQTTPSTSNQSLDSNSSTTVSVGLSSDQLCSTSNEDEGPDPSWFKAATILLSLKTSAEARLKGCQNETSASSPSWCPCNSPQRRVKNGAFDIQSNGYHYGNGCDEEAKLSTKGKHIIHDNNSSSNEDSFEDDDDDDDDDDTDKDLSTTCSLCHKVYSRPSTLKAHMRIHTGEKPFQCSICDKSFSQDANLKAHLRVHSKEKPFKCQICQRRFAQSSSVTTHMRIHSGERPYKCKVCSRGFADSSTLTKHLRIHTGEKPYQCKVCEMRFSQSGNLSRHMRVHRRKK